MLSNHENGFRPSVCQRNDGSCDYSYRFDLFLAPIFHLRLLEKAQGGDIPVRTELLSTLRTSQPSYGADVRRLRRFLRFMELRGEQRRMHYARRPDSETDYGCACTKKCTHVTSKTCFQTISRKSPKSNQLSISADSEKV